MQCMRCGFYNEDTAAVCAQCGSPLATQSGQQAAPTKKGGYCSAAWKDLKSSGSWLSRMMLVGIVNIVPILNWVNLGYMASWGCSAANGRRDGLPKYTINGSLFKTGALCFCVSLLAGMAFGFAGGIVGLVPIVGALVVLIASFFFMPFAALMIFRTALFQDFSAGWKLGDIWAVCKSNFGSLFFIVFVPVFLASLVSVLIYGALVLVTALINVGVAQLTVDMYMTDAQSLATVVMIVVAVLSVLGAFLALAAVSAGTTVMYRALGIWANGAVPSWCAQSQAGQGAAAQQGYAQAAAQQQYAQPPHGYAQESWQQQQAVSDTVVAGAAGVGYSVDGELDGGTVVATTRQFALVSANGMRYVLVSFPGTIGKGSQADCIIAGDEQISRVHAMVKLDEYGGFFIEDAGSTNGTVLNGVRLTPGVAVPVRNGDVLAIGATTYTVGC